MKIYVYTSDARGGSADEEKLIKQSIFAYCSVKAENKEKTGSIADAGKTENREEFYKVIEKAEIKREENGKPYICAADTDFLSDIEFSVSHSGEFFACAVSDKRVGIDIQEVRDADIYGIAKRFFAAEERLYTDEKGELAFFDIWVRKEAVIKCTGKGMSQGLSSFSTVKNGVLADEIELDGEFCGKYRLHSLEISPVIKCAVCEFTGGSYGR